MKSKKKQGYVIPVMPTPYEIPKKLKFDETKKADIITAMDGMRATIASQDTCHIGDWNYRILRRKYNKQYAYGIYEVYYHDQTGEPISCTEEPVVNGGNSLVELYGEMDRMQQALERAILDYSDIEGKAI